MKGETENMLERCCDICEKKIEALEDYAVVSADVRREVFGKGNMKKAVNVYNDELCADCYREFYDMYTDFKLKKEEEQKCITKITNK